MDEIDNHFNTKELWVYYVPFNSIKSRLLSYFNDKSEHVKALIEEHGPIVHLSTGGSGLRLNYSGVADHIGPPGHKEAISIPINFPSVIHSIPKISSLVEKTDNEYILFPNLKKVWYQINNEKLENARTILARKDIPDDNKIVLFGVSFSEKLVSWLIPSLMFAFSLYFYIHISNLSALIYKKTYILHYPWVLFIRGLLPFIVILITILILPFFSLFLTVRISWSDLTALLRMLSVSICILSLLFLSLSFNKIRLFRKITPDEI